MSSRTSWVRFVSIAALVVIALAGVTVPTSAETIAKADYYLEFLQPPAGTQVGSNITAETYDPTGTSVQVAVVDEEGQVVTSCSAMITLSILNNPGGGTLGGLTSVKAVNGVATFDSLSIDAHGLGYTLQATSPEIAPATSPPFDIVDVGEICGPGPCSGSTATETTGVKVDAVSGESGDLLSVSLGVETLECTGYEASSDVVTFGVSGSDRTKTVTITVDKSVVKKRSNSGAAHFQVCYASPNPFTQRDGTPAPPVGGVFTGLLPDCDNQTPVPPCVLSRHKKSGDAVVSFLAPAGDPTGRT
jgi:hypothetical protein